MRGPIDGRGDRQDYEPESDILMRREQPSDAEAAALTGD